MSPFLEFLDYAFRGNPPGVQRRLVHTWPWSHSISLVIAMAAVVFVIWVYTRERTKSRGFIRIILASLRVCLVLLTALVLMYGWMLARDITDLPDLILVIDDSASMLHVDQSLAAEQESVLRANLDESAFREATRWNVAKTVLLGGRSSMLSTLRERYNVKFYRLSATPRFTGNESGTLANDIRSATIDANQAPHDSSRLGAGLRSILEAQRGRPTAAVVMFTDGITTEGKTISEAANYARRMDIPLFLVGVGNDKPERDVRISDLVADDVVFVGDMAHFDFKMTANGFAGQRVTARLTQKGITTPLAERELVVGEDATSQPVRLSFRPAEVGDFEFRVEVTPGPADANPANNHLERMMSVRDETIRVLFVQDYPSFEYRALKNLLERGLKRDSQQSEKAFKLTVMLQEADADYAQVDESASQAFPVTREDLFEYDVVIFGDVNPAFFSESLLRNVADFVRVRGGGLIVSCGPRYTPLSYRGTPLADVLPIRFDTASAPSSETLLDRPLRVRPTSLGLTSPMIQIGDDPPATNLLWTNLPPMYWLLRAPELRSGARVLVETVGSGEDSRQPVVCLQFVGAGKVVMNLTDETYRWAHHPDGAEYYARYWLQTIRYLSRSKLLGTGRVAEVATDKEGYRLGDPVGLRVRFFDDRAAPAADEGVTIVIEQEGGGRRRANLRRDAANRGIFQTSLTQLAAGSYRAWLATPTLPGQPPSTRFTITAPQGELGRLEMDARDLKEAAQISRGKFYTVDTAERLLKDLPEGRQVRVESLPPKPIWNSSFLAGLFVALIVSEWLLRKKAGML